MSSKAVDIYVIYRILRELTTDFDEMEAYKLGIIDDKGKLLKKPRSREEKDAYGHFQRFIVNMKRILGKAGLQSKTSNFAAALFMLREYDERDLTDLEILEGVKQEMDTLNEDFVEYLDEEIANVTGSAVAGTGDDTVHWVKRKKKGLKIGPFGGKKKYGVSIDGVTFLRRMAKQKFDNRKST